MIVAKSKGDDGRMPDYTDANDKSRLRPNASPNGWSAERRDLSKDDGTTAVYGWGADGVEGWRDVK
jgi:hypothetical protein